MLEETRKEDKSNVSLEVFHDQQGRNYKCDLKNPLGKGAQGMVLRVKEDIYSAIKIDCIGKKPKRDTTAIASFEGNIARLRRLPVPAHAKISMPVSLLGDAAGYVMRLLGEMKPLGKLLPRWEPEILREDELPAWIKNVVEDDLLFGKHLNFYVQSGGLRTRLYILLQLAQTLSALHGEGLLFGDLSPNNVQIGAENAVWLIDVDNICPNGESKNIIYTPGFGAPEVAAGESPVSIAADKYSFALLAFELLTMSHPFLSGVAVLDADIDSNAEVEANEGILPWLYDSDDQSNMAPNPLHQYTLTGPLFSLFSNMFGQGRTKKSSRPPVWIFRQALANAYDHCICCPNCGMSLVLTEHDEKVCPFCDEQRPPILTAYNNTKFVFAHEIDKKAFALPARAFRNCPLTEDKDAIMIAEFEKNIRISPCPELLGKLYYISDNRELLLPEFMDFPQGEFSSGIRLLLKDKANHELLLKWLDK